MKVHVSDLRDFVDTVKHEGFDAIPQLQVEYSTHVDDTLPPFSDEYFAQQLRLYKEIAGRDLDQESGELHPVNMDEMLKAPNPLAIYSVEHIGEHVRCLSTMLSLADLSGHPEVLDMGAGHGVSSEVFAFSACRVHAIDIDPALGELSVQRAGVRGFALERSVMNFDAVGTLENGRYDAAFFFQSLHHCLRPWDLIGALADKLRDGGVIGFAGEPIQTSWWRSWGLRLDPESLFVARELGWFESGWSHDFIRQCFERNGFELTFFTGGLNGQEIGIATRSTQRLQSVKARAAQLSQKVINPPGDPHTPNFHSNVGDRVEIHGQPGFLQRAGVGGPLLFGPYVSLDAGSYTFSCLIDELSGSSKTEIIMDVTSAVGAQTHCVEHHAGSGGARNIQKRFSLESPAKGVEIRAFVSPDARWFVSDPVLSRLM